ncbi:hypothetical protein HLB42_07850 [Deinococcus sp. D7000]|nr:hypothetical protein HLB42_07850 [Deinococcus sp. D7000]
MNDETVKDNKVEVITPRPILRKDKASVSLPGNVTTPDKVPPTEKGKKKK